MIGTMVKVNLGLHRFAGQRGRKSVFVGFNGHKAAFVHRQCRIAEHRERILWQAQETRFVIFPKLLNQPLFLVVGALGILLTPFPQGFVKIVKGHNGRNWHKGVSAAVAHLVFHVALFITGRRITELRTETVMQHGKSMDIFRADVKAGLAATEAPTPVTPTAPKKYYRVQVGAYSVKANADAMLAKIKAAGFTDAFVKYSE